MQEIINSVAQKAGINPDQAHHAVHAVMQVIKDKLPAGLGDHFVGLISGEQPAGGQGGMPDLGEIMGKLGGMFGGDKK